MRKPRTNFGNVNMTAVKVAILGFLSMRLANRSEIDLVSQRAGLLGEFLAGLAQSLQNIVVLRRDGRTISVSTGSTMRA